MVAKEGQMAVMQTLDTRQRHGCKAILERVYLRSQPTSIPALNSTPDEVQKDALEKRDVASAQTPSISVLNREANVPTKTAPSDQGGEEANQCSADDDDAQRLRDGQAVRWAVKG